jgi:hypothetical protein
MSLCFVWKQVIAEMPKEFEFEFGPLILCQNRRIRMNRSYTESEAKIMMSFHLRHSENPNLGLVCYKNGTRWDMVWDYLLE